VLERHNNLGSYSCSLEADLYRDNHENEYYAHFRSIQGSDDGNENNFNYVKTGSLFEKRMSLSARYSWAIPKSGALRLIARYAPIVEMGAGTGYWAKLLRDMKVDVVAYDINPPSKDPQSNTYHGGNETWTQVLRGEPRDLRHHADRTLFLCWPPYDTRMAYDCLCHYKGKRLIYIGEGHGGCTGDDMFHNLLEQEWGEVLDIGVPQWWAIHDRLWLYQRKGMK
jgi:hypothetical protein